MATTKEKRVACLYRVSTKGQVDKDDIPMQKQACREFIQKQTDWQLVKEYMEMGVSGYKVSAKKRDEIQRAKLDAENGLFDVLLVFMFDRLGRKEDETPFVVQWFHEKGIEVWSVKEGQQRFDSHVDKLMNYIRFWQSSGESEKTSMRVDEKHQQMVKAGEFRGGAAPYGYKLIKSGVENKKGKELKKMVIDEYESSIVKEIFNLVHEYGYGNNRIARHLNEKEIPSKNGGNWTTGVIGHMLRNPIYKGYLTYGKRTYYGEGFIRQDMNEWVLSDEQIEELVIIDSETWNRVNEIRTSRIPNKIKNEETKFVNVTKSPLLFVGMIKCGHCESPLTTTYNYKSWKLADGTVKKKQLPKYRCSGKALLKTNCDGQTIYSKDRIEGMVLKRVYKYLDYLKDLDLTKEINKFRNENNNGEELQLKQLQKQIEECYQDLSTLNKEVPKSIMGKSSFKPELLSNLIEEKENEINDLNEKISKLENIVKNKKSQMSNIIKFQKRIPVWREEFESAPYEKKKMMLRDVIDYIIVHRDSVDVKLNIIVERFLNSDKGEAEGQNSGFEGRITGQCSRRTRESQYDEYTAQILQKLLVANF